MSAEGAVPAGVADEIALGGETGLFRGVEDGEKVVGLSEGELGMAKRGHGGKRGGFFRGERADGFVAFEERLQMIEVDGDGVVVCGVL